MAIVAGDFTASQVATAITTADKMWKDPMMNADFEANVDIWDALKKEQNATVKLLTEGEKDRDVKVTWLNMCNQVARDCSDSADDCDLSGDEMGSDSKTYGINECKEWSFTVDEMTFRNNDYSMEQAVAKGFLIGDKVLSDAIAATAIARVESYKGVNAVQTGIGTWNAATTETDISGADWNEGLFPYLYRVGIQNKLSNTFLLSGSNLFDEWVTVQANTLNANGKGAGKLYKMIRMYFDLFNIDVANSPALKTYLINRGSIAFASKVHYGPRPVQYKTQDRYSIGSRNLKGVRYDVFYTNRCTAKTMKHDFKLIANYDYFDNPLGCDGGRTGVLAFNRT